MNICEDNSADVPDEDSQLRALDLQAPCSVFPVHLYQDLYSDLHESARWTIHYENVEQCLDATAEILAAGSRSVEDKVNVEEFLRHVLNDAICKGVVESNHKTWNAEVRAHLLNTCIALASTCSSGLASLRARHDDVWSTGATPPVRRVDIVSQLLAIFASIFDQWYSSFTPTFAREPVPSECMDKVHRLYRFLPSNIPNWTRAVAAKFIEMEGYVRVFEVLQLVPLELRHIDNFLRPLETSDYILAAQVEMGTFDAVEVDPVAALDCVLRQIAALLDPDDSSVPIATDVDLGLLPQVLMKLHVVLKVFHSEEDAFSKMLVAHVAHLQALLAKRSFATLLLLAKQANMLFNPGSKDGPRPAERLKPLLAWISDQQVAQQLLGANLHLRPYVDALRDFLMYLTQSGSLADTIITKLIANMLQDGVMDMEKDNISRLLKDIIPVADLDIVMAAKNAIAPASIKTSRDAISVFLVTLSMAQNPHLHEKEGLVLQCLDIGWSLLLSAEHSHFVINSGSDSRGQENLFAWVVMKADATWQAHDQAPEYSKLYAKRCIQCIKEHRNLPETLHTLRSLLNGFKEPLLDETEALTTVVTSLCDWIQSTVTHAAQASEVTSALSPASFSIPFRRFLELIQFIVVRYMPDRTSMSSPDPAMPSDLITRLWENTVCAIPEGSSSLEQDVEYAFVFFASLIRAKAIPLEPICGLINNIQHLRPPQHITSRSLDQLFHIMLYANLHLGTLNETNELASCAPVSPNDAVRSQVVVNGSGKVLGMDYLFQVLIHAVDDRVAQEAASMLVRVYIKPYCDYGRCPASWTTFVSDIVARLVEYASALVGGSTLSTVDIADRVHVAESHSMDQELQQDPSVLCGFATRTMVLLISILDWCHGVSMPIQRPHHASAKGLQVEMAAVGMPRTGLPPVDSSCSDIDVAFDRDKGKILLGVHSLMYVGDIRKILEQVAGCKPGTLHLTMMGAEQGNDSLQLGTLMQQILDASGGMNSLTVQVKQVQARISSRSERLLAAPAALHVLTSDVQEAILESSPDVTMSADESLVNVLTALLDTPCSAYEVHQHAYQLLCRLQTWQPLMERLRSCMADSKVNADHTEINQLFYFPPHDRGREENGAVTKWRPQPGAVLYALEALYTLMEPAMPPKNGSQDVAFVCCPNRTILTVIEAADSHFTAERPDKFFWLQFYHTVAKVLKWVLAHAKLPPGADPAETSQTTGAEGPRSLKSSQPGINEEVVSGRVSASATADSSGSQQGAELSTSPTMKTTPDPGTSGVSGVRAGADAVLESSSSSDRAAGTPPKVPTRQLTLEPEVLGRLVNFWVVLATRLSKGLPEPDEGCVHMQPGAWRMHAGPALSQLMLLDEVMRIIKSLVAMRRDLLEGMIFGQSFEDMANELLFNAHDESVRAAMRDLVSLCAGTASPAGRGHLLTIMASPDMAEIAEREHVHCQQYFEALASVVQAAAEADDGESVVHLQQLFVAEFAVLQALQPQPTERTLGHLTFLHSLWRFFVEHPSHAPQEMLAPMRDNETVTLILDSLLFPEAGLMQRYHRRASRSPVVNGADDAAITDERQSAADSVLPATALSPEGRTMAYALLHTIVTYSDNMMSYCLQRLLNMLGPGPPSAAMLRQQTVEHRMSIDGGALALDCGQWCGLTNAGATCYMNAVLQQLFMQPTVRALVLAREAPAFDTEDDDTLFQIQRTFAHLALSTARAYTPSGVWASLKDLEGQPINVMEHQDAHEHLYQLHNIIDGNEIETCETKPMFAAMGGTSVLRIRCSTVDYESRRTEPFTHISVDVQNMHNLERALHAYFQEELMEGDNAYHCDQVNAKVPAIKRTLLAKLPHTFVVQLKRFEFDFKNGMRVKIQERLEFPSHLNLRPFSEAAVLEAEAAEAALAAGVSQGTGCSAADGSSLTESFFEYELKGVVVHIGSAFAGHYYSFVKERGPNGRWLCMDDTSVTLWDPSRMEECCFGGPGPDGRMRLNSAYMLVYERRDSLEPVVVKEELRELVRRAARDGIGIKGDEAFLPPQRTICASGGVSNDTEPLVLGLPQRLFSEVMEQNLLMSHAANWTSPSHLDFMKAVVTDCLQINTSSDCHDIRHSMASGSISGVKTMSCDTRDTSSKRLAVAASRAAASLASAPQDAQQPLTAPAAPPVAQEGPNNEDLATQLALKYCVSVLNFVLEMDDSMPHFFSESVEHGLQRTSVLEACVDIVLSGLLWRLPDGPSFSFENSAVHTDRAVRSNFTGSALRVLSACSDQLSKADLSVTHVEASVLLKKVYHFLDVLWLLLKTYLTSKVYAAVDSLLVMTAEVLNHAPLRMVTDQVSTDPVAIVATALPNVVNERLSESPHFFRPAHALWKVMRMLLFNASTEPPGRYERIVLRNAFVPDRAVEPEDTFLAARYGEERGKPVSDLAVMMRKSDMLLRAADIIVNSSNKNYEKYVEFFLGPFLAMIRARPDVHEQVLIPILVAFHDVCVTDDDTDFLDRAALLVRVLAASHSDDLQEQRIRDIFCYTNGRAWPMGMYGCLSIVFRSAQRQEGRGPQAFNACRLFLNVCAEFQKWNPELLHYAVPTDVREAELALNLTTSALTMMSKYHNRLSNDAAVALYQYLRSFLEDRRA